MHERGRRGRRAIAAAIRTQRLPPDRGDADADTVAVCFERVCPAYRSPPTLSPESRALRS